jgi:hypothetical protein
MHVLVVFALVLAAALAPATAASASSPYLYNSTVPLASVGNLPSEGFEAYALNELGNQITLDHAGNVGLVVVTMSSWACESGTWYAHNCVSTPGHKFTWPITFSIYHAAAGTPPVAGSLIARSTRSFAMPYRPSANNTHCTGANLGKWWDAALQKCFNGKASNITFDFAGVSLPKDVVYGITYNTTHYGYSPIGQGAACFSTIQGCFYDSLNIGLTQDPTDVSAGRNPGPTGTVFVNANIAYGYCDAGLAGFGKFRLDSPTSGCWSLGVPGTSPYYIPAVQLRAGGCDQNESGSSGQDGDCQVE